MNERPEAILFDLFGTLVFFDDERLPRMEVSGRSVVMTVRSMPELLARHCPHVGVAGFLTTLQEIGAQLQDIKRRTGIEILTHVRFERALAQHGASAERAAEGAAEMAREHMQSLAQAVVCPGGRIELLRELQQRYRLALLSNFDDGPTARSILERYGLAPFFEATVISAEAGIRKPNADIFTQTCSLLSLPPQRCLYVGDTWREDIEGAAGAGLSAVWITPQQIAEPPALGRIGNADELPGWLQQRLS